ncbi:uncharacterized protein LOC132165087 [Corylus avellana]|uniref:uncharacterized protein LOC132165087 n=1 Tax=Corylus avellana TaxID=13451 RepID=UPI001E20F7CE|nr:uncharacterized protein LOC132165087 [Corylus avellana]
MDAEDDLFFADLSKQISLLIMEDDEDVDDPLKFPNCPPVSLQDFAGAINPPARLPPALHEQACRRESKGTGVFIPQLSQPRRKQRHGRFASYNTISHRQPADHNTRMISRASSNHSFKPKKV